MVRYRRNKVKGGTYFFTVVLKDRGSKFFVEHIDLLRSVFKTVCKEKPFEIIAMVVLPDHLHSVWRLPEEDDDYSGRWKSIKSKFSRELVKKGVPVPKNIKGEYFLWQRRYWEHTIRNDEDLQMHGDYIHYNPVKHGYVKQVKGWPHSSFHRYVRVGLLNIDWGSMMVLDDRNEFGE